MNHRSLKVGLAGAFDAFWRPDWEIWKDIGRDFISSMIICISIPLFLCLVLLMGFYYITKYTLAGIWFIVKHIFC